tara:strand:- start:668 stop:1099 length:432 start_codon:yes stop_codon:yes gene_type:complete
MLQKLNPQFIFSYLGLIPYLIININKYFIFQINLELTIHFSIYYTVIIIVFIGSMNWNLDKKLDKMIVIYGLLPSLYSIIIIILNLINFDFKKIILLLVIFLIIQLFFDYKFIYSKKENKIAFYFLRIPLTFLISIFLLIFIS